MRTCVRTYVCHVGKLFTPCLVVELSSCAENMCMHVTSINVVVQILTLPGINNNRDFQNSRFIYGDLIVLNSEWHWTVFPVKLILLRFPANSAHRCALGIISVGCSQRYLWLGSICTGWECQRCGIAQIEKYVPGAQCASEYFIMYCKLSICRIMIFWFGIFVVQDKKSSCLF